MKTLFTILVFVAGLYIGSAPVGPLPALGPFLDPVRGVWASTRGTNLPRSVTYEVSGLTSEVEVIYDDRRVPHIFAETA